MHERLFKDHFMFGSQYYRAPSPPPEDWAADLRRMVELGFNTVKFWIQWRWNHPEMDRFDFDDIDGLMAEADRHGLKVMLNTIVDVAPVWLYRHYPDASMVTLDGRKIGPQTQPHRQIGGLGVCLNHTEAMEHMFAFLQAAYERYSDHPALSIWNVASEPELTQSMSEMRLYADDHRKMGDMLCYCPRCEFQFKVWLEERYGDVAELNRRWNRNYRSFEEVELPKTRNTFNDMIDWRMFFVDVLGRNVRRRFEVAKAADKGAHPLMCHHVFIQGFPVTSTANDPWNVGKLGDLHGFTQMDDPMMHDILRSCARGKPVVSAEMLMLMGYTLDLHREITETDVKRHVFTGLAANLKGFVFWQYRPELLGREAPAWGLTRLDGSSTPWLEAFAKVGRALQKHADFLHEARPRDARVAILYSPENQIFAWASTGNEKNATNSLMGFHRALYEQSHVVDFIHVAEVAAGMLDTYAVLIMPFPYCLPSEALDQVRAWVERGGVLISEAYTAGWNLEEGRHSTTVPGDGLDAVFGVRQDGAVPPDEDDGHITITTTRAVGALAAGFEVHGAIVQENLAVDGAEILAGFRDGRPAITVNRFGKGKAVAIGSYLGLPAAGDNGEVNARLLASLVDEVAQLDHPTAEDARVRVDVLSNGSGRTLLVFRNLEAKPLDCRVLVPALASSSWNELFSSEELLSEDDRDGVAFSIALSPHEVKAFLD